MAVKHFPPIVAGARPLVWLFAVCSALSMLGACSAPHPKSGEELAHAYCSSCHAFPEPQLLDRRTWQNGVLPQMAPRVGVRAQSLSGEMSRSPYMRVLPKPV